MLIISIWSFYGAFGQQLKGSLHGTLLNEMNEPVEGGTISIEAFKLITSSGRDGEFKFEKIPAGKIRLTITCIGYKQLYKEVTVTIGEPSAITITLEPIINVLEEVVVSEKDFNNVKRLRDEEGTMIFAGKKNDVIILDKTNANTAENIPRQVFSKVPGVYEWDLDGSGVQTSISVRGLNPHRSWEFNVRQNGYNVNSDMFGYPESHYNPPTEALSRVSLVRGGASLQYGPQFGGMLNYIIKEGPRDEKVDFETRQTIGPNKLYNTYNALGGTIGKLNYFAYFNYRVSDGYRPNSHYDWWAYYAGLHYTLSEKVKLGFEFSRMYYIDQFAGGLTDAQFEADPRQSNRSRNYFQPNMNIPALLLDIRFNGHTSLSLKSNYFIGQRNSVMFTPPGTVPDTILASTLQYAPRQVDRDYYNSFTNELRVLHHYTIAGREQAISIGGRYSNAVTNRKQQGTGTTTTDFDLTVIGDYALDLDFNTVNYAVFAENLFRVGKQLSITPGARLDIVRTRMTGNIDYTSNSFNYDKNRSIPLLGLGLQYKLNDLSNIYANWSQAYRPILYSDLTPSASLDVVDPNMKDSKGFNADIGVRGNLNDLLIYDVGLFYLYYGDRVGSLALTNDSGQAYIYKTNVGTSAARGVESFIEFHPTAINNLKATVGDIGVFTSIAFDYATYIDGLTSVNGQDVQIKGKKLENAPQWIARGGITYGYKFLSTTFQASYVSEIFTDALNTPSSSTGVTGIVPSYIILDWNATFRFSEYNIKAGINNLADEKYFTRRINAYPGPGILPADGRTYYISLGKEF